MVPRATKIVLGVLGGAVALAMAFFGHAPHAAAELPRVPSADGEVVETLPIAANDPKRREIAGLRRALARDPRNLAAAVRLARLDIRLARERSDPRYLGHAQAALGPWWAAPDAPTDVLVLRATIEQSLHDFDAALRDLDAALARTPDDLQGWLTRATVLTVQARYDEARASCAHVASAPLAHVVCETQIESLTGGAKAAYTRLAAAVEAGRASRDEEEWAVSSLAEYAARAGDTQVARSLFERALAIDPSDAYARGAYADLLLDAHEDAAVVALLQGQETNDALLLRLAIAEARLRAPAAEAHLAAVTARFDASRARGDVVHRREEARYWLELRGEPARALELARANWDVQKEPWDARILLEAAAAAKDPEAARPAREHVLRTKLEDPAIAKVLR